MTVSKTLALSSILLFIIALSIGCSDNTFVTEGTTMSSSASPVAYLPLEQGLRVSYVNLEPGPSYFDVEVGQPILVAGYPGYEMKRTDRSTGADYGILSLSAGQFHL